MLWGLVTGVGHGSDSDDTAAGLWRPRSSADWRGHDQAGTLVAVGSGSHVQPAYSVTLNEVPRTLQVADGSDGIAEIEAWAARVGALPQGRWNTIAGTAAAFVAAGSLPSRVNPAASGSVPLPR